LVEIDSLRQIPLEEATTVLSKSEEPICFCAMEVQGIISGEMILAFDDASGLALADMLMDQPQGTSTDWSELVSSAVLETTNIVCCAYLNSLSRDISGTGDAPALVPAPPRFNREFAESLMQFALMGQAIEFDQVILAQTRFQIDGEPVDWNLLFLPDAKSMTRLPELLADTASEF
jgi:chemotaxis protein CheC